MSKKDIIIQFIQENIDKGIYKAGSRIMSESDMAERFHIARMTVRNAIDILVSQGIIIKKHGSGNYISSKIFKKKYIIIAPNAEFFLMETGVIYKQIANMLKQKIIEAGYEPYIYLENHDIQIPDYATSIGDINLDMIAGYISFTKSEPFYKLMEDRNIPIVSLFNEFSEKYPAVNFNNTYLYKTVIDLLQKYNFDNALIFRYNYLSKINDYNIDYFCNIGLKEYMDSRYSFCQIIQSKYISEISKQIENKLKTLPSPPQAIVFFDDTLFNGCQSLFHKYNYIFKNTKIITHSNNNEIYSNNMSVCRLTYYSEEIVSKTMHLLLTLIDGKCPSVTNYSVKCSVINEECLK